jgi:eukaryotic-like serine/threonine-protein kinase
MSARPDIPGYELLRPLGGGPLTEVFAARQAATDQPVVVKVLRPAWATDPTAVKLLRREARAGLAVRHPHLVRVRDAHVAGPPFFLVMELLTGESLRERLRRDYRLDVRTALWVGRQTADALAALHRAGFLHGDLKPDNIVLCDDGPTRLIDLGFAHRLGENAELARNGYILGTANYLAPELCGPEPSGDFRSDVFSLGVTLFEMLTGELPYPTGSVPEILERHREEEPSDLRDHAGLWPVGLPELLADMLVARPDERPKSGRVVQDLIALEIATFPRRRSA